MTGTETEDSLWQWFKSNKIQVHFFLDKEFIEGHPAIRGWRPGDKHAQVTSIDPHRSFAQQIDLPRSASILESLLLIKQTIEPLL